MSLVCLRRRAYTLAHAARAPQRTLPAGFDPRGAARVASLKLHAARGAHSLEINDDAKEIVQQLGNAINAAVERSSEVADTIARLREAGYEVELMLKLEIGLRERGAGDADEEPDAAATLELTEEDRRTLRSMKIRFDDAD